jgi:hypothetical protein
MQNLDLKKIGISPGANDGTGLKLNYFSIVPSNMM